MQIRINNTPYQPQQRQTFKSAAVVKVANGLINSAKKVPDNITTKMAYGLGEMVSWKPVQKLIDWLKDKNYQEHLAAFVGVTLSGFYMLDTAKSKKIEKDQKLPLMLNQATVCAMSTAGAYTLNRYLNKKLNHVAELFHIAKIDDPKLQEKFLKFKADPQYANVVKRTAESNKGLAEIIKGVESKFEFTKNIKVYLKEEIKKLKGDKVAEEFLAQVKKGINTEGKDIATAIKELYLSKMKDSKAMQNAFNRETMNGLIKKIAGADKTKRLTNLMNGFRTAQALMVFALIYRFVSPVIATPFANMVSEKLENRKKVA